MSIATSEENPKRTIRREKIKNLQFSVITMCTVPSAEPKLQRNQSVPRAEKSNLSVQYFD